MSAGARHVAIVGAGPVGLTLANLLARRGVRVTVLEARAHAYPLPRAIHFDGETMRIFQAAGVAEAVLTHTHPGVGMLFRAPGGRIALDWTRDAETGPMGWRESYRFFQPGLEAALAEALGRYPHATLRRGAAVAGADEGAVSLSDGSRIEADFIVGCDGAASVIREVIGGGIGGGIEDLGFQERWLVTDLRLTGERPDLGDHSVQYCDPDHPATYVRGAGDWRRWEIRLAANDPDEPDDAEVWRRLSRWITPDDATLERAAVYTFRSAIASRWRAGGMFIAGDAAHQMPPFMGQGMCAGIRDAANLAWKIAAATGPDDPLLETYETERAPHVRAFIDMTMRLGRLINQTAAGEAPTGRMSTIQPALGPGLGERDSVAGRLAPQCRINDIPADDRARGAFYMLVREHADDLPTGGRIGFDGPVFSGADAWLAEAGLFGVIVRPDGYVLAGAATAEALSAAARDIPPLRSFFIV